MTPMDHAEAHERIADLALEPARLTALAESTDTSDVALREHVRACPSCRAQLAEWRGFQASLDELLAGVRREQLEPILAPDELRPRVLATARSEPRVGPRTGAVGGRLGLTGRAVLALAAVFALIAVGVVLVREQSARLDRAALERMWLSETVGAVGRILAEPDHRLVTLRGPDGREGGSIAWSRHDLVVLAGSLDEPSDGYIYRCWLAYEGREEAVGVMWFVDGTALWVGSTENWASVDLDEEMQFMVTLEPDGETGARHSGPVVLEATLGG